MTRRQTNFGPAMIAALLLHLIVLFGGLFVWPRLDRPPQATGVTAVTLVSAAAELRPAVQADETASAAAETPVAQATPQALAPNPAPTPPAPPPAPKAAAVAPKPAPAPTPKATTTPTKPLKTQPAAKAAPAGLDLEALTSSLSKSARAGGARSAAAKGPNRPETAEAARAGQGAAAQATADAASAVAARLMRAWNPNCDVEGAGKIVVSVEFNLTPDGALSGQVRVLNPQSGSVWGAAADRATRAVAQASPFSELPRQTFSQWKVFRANFRGDQACRQ